MSETSKVSCHVDLGTQEIAPKILILMAVYNGATHLAEQLQSIAAQDYKNWQLLISDDGSQDESLKIIDDFRKAGHDVIQFDGPKLGAAANFMSLIRRADDFVSDDSYIAFSDQDDIWFPEKLSHSLKALTDLETDGPKLYCSRLWIVDEKGLNPRMSPPRPYGPSFQNALVQNIASGNTTVLNPEAQKIVRTGSRKVGKILIHDWWMYQVITGVGGQVIHDDTPRLLYRQHSVNAMGANDTWAARFDRVSQILKGDLREWNAMNIEALMKIAPDLSSENLELLMTFKTSRNDNIFGRVIGFLKLRPHRQSSLEQFILWAVILLGRI